ncbi:hypothetical protein B0H17DRAFT_1190746 [Mycena rosella]|uniref:Uncharacterized protein n=1 Tax=Mycena rosella TaxID=1033263 RepID=A0AAD7H0J6_MYCRO|nr:hypothetical protein B0H17DRAFT_1190746 [Mycena rosella]
MPIFPGFPSNFEQLHRIVEDLHDTPDLPEKYDTPKKSQQPKLLRGWRIDECQNEIIFQWLLLNTPELLWLDGNDNPVPGISVFALGNHFADVYGLEGGVAAVHILEGGQHLAGSMFWFDSNDVIPEQRYTKKEWAPLAEALQLTEEPKWYLKLII